MDGGPSMILRLSGQHGRQGKTDIDQSHKPDEVVSELSGDVGVGVRDELDPLVQRRYLGWGGGQEHWTIAGPLNPTTG